MGRRSNLMKQRRAPDNPGNPAHAVTQTAQLLKSEVRYTGPLPMGQEFAKYEETLPGAAHRIVSMAESQQVHRQELEKFSAQTDREVQHTLVKVWGRNSGWGIVCATYLGTLLIVGGILLIWHGKSAEGLGTIGTAVATLVGVYVWGGRQKSKNEQPTDS